MGAFKEPHGGVLRDLYLPQSEAETAKQAAGDYPSWDLTERQLCDIELLLNGAFQRPRPVNRVEACLEKPVHEGVGDLELKLALGEALAQ